MASTEDEVVVLVRWLMSSIDACAVIFFFQAEDGIRDLVRSRGLGDVYKRQEYPHAGQLAVEQFAQRHAARTALGQGHDDLVDAQPCLLYTSDAADERSSVDLGGRRIIKKKKQKDVDAITHMDTNTHSWTTSR